MHGVDFKGEMNDYILDNNRKINNAHLENVCKFRNGSKTCRYIGLSAQGYYCAKKTPLKKVLDERAKKELMIAKGDNCEGFGKNEKKG